MKSKRAGSSKREILNWAIGLMCVVAVLDLFAALGNGSFWSWLGTAFSIVAVVALVKGKKNSR